MPITLAGSDRRRVVERDTGAGAVADSGSAHGSIVCCRVVEGDTGAGAVAGSAHGSIVRCRVVGRDTGAGGGAGSAHGSTTGPGRRGCAARADCVFGAAGRGDVAGGVDCAVGALGWAASRPGAGAAGGVAFTRAPRAAGLLESKGGGSVGFLTWSGDGVESAGPTAFAGGEIGSPLCA